MDEWDVRHPEQAIQQSGTEDKHWEDGRDDLLPLSSRRDPAGDVLREADDRRGVSIPVETEGRSEVFEFW